MSRALPPTLPVVWASPFALEAPTPPAAPAARLALAAVERIAPVRLWSALSHRIRWRLVLRMAAGEELTAPLATRGSGARLQAVRKHLVLLREAGVAESREGLDRRSEVYFIPPERRPEPGVLEFGSCRIVLAEAAPEPSLSSAGQKGSGLPPSVAPAIASAPPAADAAPGSTQQGG